MSPEKCAVDYAWPHGERCTLSLTFDDAKLSQTDFGIPILDQYSIKATFFVRGDRGRVPERIPQWKQAIASGHEIGSHLVNHPCSGNFAWIGPRGAALENYTLEQIRREIVEANETIEELLGVVPVSFAYPCGLDFVGRGKKRQSYVPLIAEQFLIGRGYRGEYMNNPEFCDLAIVQSAGIDDLSLDEMVELIEKAESLGYWAIFTAHDARPGDGKGASEKNLHGLCSYLQENRERIWSATTGEVARLIAQTQRNL